MTRQAIDDQCNASLLLYTILIPLSPSHHLPSLHTSLNPNPPKYNPYTSPLTNRQSMIKDNNTQQHRKQFPRHRDHNKSQRTEMLDRFKYEQLA